jgi:hypothetical protein
MIWKVLVSAPFFVLPWEWAVNEIAFLVDMRGEAGYERRAVKRNCSFEFFCTEVRLMGCRNAIELLRLRLQGPTFISRFAPGTLMMPYQTGEGRG